ncbi:MAG: xanthine dehydrogenase family protein molybdopterin-binding subunit [Chloroflexi bacterium]|nr:xanthine dehydrogenase family protein molybdopterin-binding subunit [Chloroflexota bacterium]
MTQTSVVLTELPAQLEVVGKGVPRVDALDKVTGKAKYTGDFREQGMLFAKLVRSPHPHANIKNIDVSAALAYPGVKGIVLPEDAPDRRMGYFATCDRQVLPKDGRVRYVGEPIAVVVATTSEIAEEAVALVRVDYEALPAIFDAEEAMSPDCPVAIHPMKHTYSKGSAGGAVQAVPEIPNAASRFKIRKGDVEKGFKEADVIVENRFTVARVGHGRMEKYIADAWMEADGTLVVRRAKKGIWRDKDWLCQLFGLPASKVRVMESYIGGDFGGKGWVAFEGLVALAAMKLKRLVRLESTREEDFHDGTMAPGAVMYIKDGLKKDGTIVARETTMILEGGGYTGGGSGQSALCIHNGILACYNIPNWKSDGYVAYTNNPPTGTLRGVDAPRGSWAAESQMDCDAHALGMDPLEFRLKNVAREGDTCALGQVLQHISPREAIEKAAELIQWGAKSEGDGDWKRGKGLGLANYGVAPMAPSDVLVKVIRDGTIEVRHGTDEVGQGLNTVVAQLAAEEFKIKTDRVKVIFGDTLTAPWDYSSSASRCTWFTGNATVAAARDAKQQLFMLAGKRMGVAAEELDTRDGRVFCKTAPEKSIPFSDLFQYESAIGHGEILGKGYYRYQRQPFDPETGQCANYYPTYPYLAYGVEAAVNTRTGEVRVLKVSAGVDVGQPINIKMIEGQIEGGIVMAIGQSLLEEVMLKNGVHVNANFGTYRMPTVMESPYAANIKVESVGKPDPTGLHGGKPLGEMVLIPFFAALGNAIYDATGVRMTHSPMTRESVFWGLRQHANAH